MSRAALFLAVGSMLWLGCQAPPVPPPPASEPEPTSAAAAGLRPLDPAGVRRSEAWRGQVLYLVLPDRFHNGDPANDQAGIAACSRPSDPFGYHGGDLEGLRQKLGYLEDLGVTAVWSTPVYRQVAEASGRCGYHGYWADFVEPDDGAVEPKLGTPAQLDALVQGLHARKMRFMLDMVVNHSGDLATLPRQRPGWFHPGHGCAQLGPATQFCPLDGHPDFAQEQPDVARYLNQQSAGWVERHDLDAIRMDTAKHVPPAYFAQEWIPAVRAKKADIFLLAEVFDEGPSHQAISPYLEAGFDSAFHFGLRRGFIDAFARGGSVDGVSDRILEARASLGLDRLLAMVNLLDNHDVPRFTHEPGLAVSEPEIRRRYHLALAALFTVPGVPQLYYGDELGLYGGADPDNRRDFPAWAEEPAQRALPHPGQAVAGAEQTFAWTRKLIGLRKELTALQSGEYTELWRQNGFPHRNTLAFLRHTAGNQASGGRALGERVLVVLNNDVAPTGGLSVPLCANPALDMTSCGGDGQVWEERLGTGAGALATASGGRISLDVPGRTAALYAPRPPDGGTAVTFELRANTRWGERLELCGDVPELGGGDPAGAVALEPSDCQGSRCTWRVTVRYLPRKSSAQVRLLRREGGHFRWEHATPQAVHVPDAAELHVRL